MEHAQIAPGLAPHAAAPASPARAVPWATPVQLHPAATYEALRARCLADFVALRGRRRVRVTPALSVLFESRETVLLQVYEVLRAEGWDLARAERELAGYACLVPDGGHLCATAMIDGGDRAEGRRLARLLGRPGALRLACGPCLAPSARADEEVGGDEPVHYLRWPIDRRLAAAIVGDPRPLTLHLDAGALSGRVDLPPALRRELARDLGPLPSPTPLLRGDDPCQQRPTEHHR